MKDHNKYSESKALHYWRPIRGIPNWCTRQSIFFNFLEHGPIKEESQCMQACPNKIRSAPLFYNLFATTDLVLCHVFVWDRNLDRKHLV